MENPMKKWMIWGVSPFRETPIYKYILPPDSPTSIAPFWIQICGYFDRIPLRWSIGLVIRHKKIACICVTYMWDCFKKEAFCVAYLPPIDGKLRRGYYYIITCYMWGNLLKWSNIFIQIHLTSIPSPRWCLEGTTPPKTNMESENRPLQKKIPFNNSHLNCFHVSVQVVFTVL